MGSADQWDDVSCYICATANDNGEPIFCCAASIVQRQGVAANADRSDDMRPVARPGARVAIVRISRRDRLRGGVDASAPLLRSAA